MLSHSPKGLEPIFSFAHFMNATAQYWKNDFHAIKIPPKTKICLSIIPCRIAPRQKQKC